MDKREKTRKKLPIPSSPWLPFEEARTIIRRLHIASQGIWRQYIAGKKPDIGHKPENIPSRPDLVYRKLGWLSWSDWFGKSMPPKKHRIYPSYEQALDKVQQLNIRTATEYFKYWKGNRPEDLPSHPERYYRSTGWQSWSHFLATSNARKINWRPFLQARDYVRKMGFKNTKQFIDWGKGKLEGKGPKPLDIPVNPHVVYRNRGWRSYGDFLGTGRVAPSKRNYIPFEHARLFVHSLGLKSRSAYIKYWNENKPAILPKDPRSKYRNAGWTDWDDFLGIVSRLTSGWRPFPDAKHFVHDLHLKNHDQWLKYCRGDFKTLKEKPLDIPTDPYLVYAKSGWISWGDWLGTGTPRRKTRIYKPYWAARVFASGLGLKNKREWKDYVAGRLQVKEKKPPDIPACPDRIYAGSGWISWEEFLTSLGRVPTVREAGGISRESFFIFIEYWGVTQEEIDQCASRYCTTNYEADPAA